VHNKPSQLGMAVVELDSGLDASGILDRGPRSVRGG